MKSPWMNHVLLATLPLALAVGACVDDNADSGMIVLRAVAPDEGCVFSPDSTTFLPSGHIDAAADRGYLVAPLVRNDLTITDGEAKTPKTIFVNGAQIVVKFYDDDVFSAAELSTLATNGLTRYLAPFSGSIPPNGATAVFPFEAVPTALMSAVGEKLTALGRFSTLLDVQIRVVGSRSGGDVESNLFRFPVEVCANCEKVIIGDCSGVTATTPVRSGGICQPSQDGQVDCCLGVATEPGGPRPLVCPASGSEL